MAKNTPYDDFINKLLEEPEQAFAPHAQYDADGDCIEFFLARDPHYGESVDNLLTLYRSRENNEIVGALIERVSAMCRDILRILPGFRLEVRDGKLPLVHIFRARLWSLRDQTDEVVHIYRSLTDKAVEFRTEVKLEDASATKPNEIHPRLNLWSLFAKSA